MPLFFVLAGVAVALTERRGTSSNVRSLGWSIVVPYLIWSVAWIGTKLAVPGAANHPLAVSDLLWAPVVPVEHLWFLYHLFFARLFWIGFGLLDRRPASMIPVAAILIVAASLLGGGGGWSDAVAYFLGNVGLLGVGSLLAPTLARDAASGLRRSQLVAGIVCSAVGFSVLFLAIRPSGISAGMFVVALAGAAMVILAARFLSVTLPAAGVRLLGFLGEASLAIYVLHLFVIALLRPILKLLGVTGVPMLAVDTVVAVGVPALAFALTLAAGFALQRPLARWVGFGTARRSHYFDFQPAATHQAAAPT